MATAISDDLSRYFATVTLINLMLGIATTATMYWLGMPNPLLWGVVAFVLNFVPYAGSAATLVLLTVVAVVSFDGLGKALAVAGCYLVLTTVEGQVVQPILVGRRLDVSPLVVFLSLWFGGWLWGIAGVALAVPMLVAAKALRLELGASEPTEAAQPGRRESTVRSRAAELLAAGTAHRARDRDHGPARSDGPRAHRPRSAVPHVWRISRSLRTIATPSTECASSPARAFAVVESTNPVSWTTPFCVSTLTW